MRIISGRHRGRKLRLPKHRIRPTADRVKEALFSILSPEIPGARVLDLFAGTGSLGLEALSRGASSVCFVEVARAAEKTLRENVEILGENDNVEIVRADALRFAASLESGYFDVAFADPPYEEGYAARLADAFRARPFARILCLEHRTGELKGADDIRKYGDTELSFFRGS